MKDKGSIYRYSITLVFALSFLLSFGQGKASNIVYNNKVEKEIFTYADTLQLDYYSQKKDIDSDRPLLVIVHGGGFAGGKRDNPYEVEFANQMAVNGYAVASISYRLTRKGKSFSCDCPSAEKMETFVATSEDISKAVLFLHSRKEKLQFNENKTVLIGSSAGAEGVLNTVFMQDHYLFKHIPKFPVAGIISLAGAVVDKEYITDSTKVPTLFFHGKKDNLVPYGTAPHHYCKPDEVGYLILDGAEAMAEQLKKLNTSYILAVDPEGNHDWAGLGYKQLPLINEFLEKIILKQDFIQQTVQLKRLNND